MWTLFWDMNSGGGLKEAPYGKVYIEAPEEEAKIIFYNKFGHNPERVSCTCCGEDYAISEGPTLLQVSGCHRGCRALATPKGGDGLYKHPDPDTLEGKYFNEHYYLEWNEEPQYGFAVKNKPTWADNYQTLKEYEKKKNVLIIYAKDIKPEEKEGNE